MKLERLSTAETERFSMNKQNNVNSAPQSNWAVLNGTDPSHIETTYLPDAVQQIGEHNLVEFINSRLNNPRFMVKFEFENVTRTLLNEEFSGLALFHHELTVPKPTGFLTKEAVQSVFDVIDICEDETSITYMVYLHEGPYANTIAEILGNINTILGPLVEALTKQLEINDYQLTFDISLTY